MKTSLLFFTFFITTTFGFPRPAFFPSDKGSYSNYRQNWKKDENNIGGGLGKVSHFININLKNPYNHVVMEPAVNSKNNTGDWKIGKYLIENKKNHGDKYTIIPKFATELTKKDLKILGGPPDCLYVDCEGCLLGFLKSDIGKFVLKSLRFVVNEMDGNNDEIDKILKKNGFKLKHVGYGCGKSCYTNVYQR